MKFRSVAIVVPCHNEVLSIGDFFLRLNAVALSLKRTRIEFVFVDDGSDDGTGTILDVLARRDSRFRVIHLARNQGQQEALLAGMLQTSSDVVVTLDADLQDPPELIPRLLVKIEEGCEIVHARRRRRPGETWFKLASAWAFYRLMRLLTRGRVLENCGDFRACTRTALGELACLPAPHRFLRGAFAHLPLQQCVVDYDRAPRHAGKSKWTLFQMARFAIGAVFSVTLAPTRRVAGTEEHLPRAPARAAQDRRRGGRYFR